MTNNMFSILKNSITFQMSLGSKELFHSNFLQWLSIVDWDCFLSLLHSLTGEKVLWWEKQNCCVEAIPGKGKRFHPDNGNIEVRREYNHYDLSIYILVGFTKPSRGGVQKKKWRPVFILENKVKYIPYQEQLDGYAQKAYDEWERVHSRNKTSDWAKEEITFVLLSLFDEVNFNPSHITTGTNIDCDIHWKKCNYKQLSENIFCNYKVVDNTLARSIIEDYCQFAIALHNLSNTKDWKVCPKDLYHDKIIKPAQEEVQLRIADIREKIHHERMLQFLIKKFQESTKLRDRCEHWNKEKEFKDKGKKLYNTGVVFYETAFSRGIGALQAFIIINDAYRLMIQLQSNQYKRCVILHSNNYNMKKVINGLGKILWEKYDPQHKYGQLFKYQSDTIGNNQIVDEILDKVVKDMENIFNNMNQLKNIP